MSTKNTDWSFEKLEEWARPALDYPELIDIARTATSNTEAKDKALEFTKERGLDEKIAKACRWLRVLRTKISEEEFEHYIQEEKEMGEKKDLRDIKFDLPEKVEILLDSDSKKIRFTDGAWGAIDFCEQLVRDLGEFLDEEYAEKHLMMVNRGTLLRTMIEVLEKNCGLESFIEVLEKNGIKVKICGFCKEYRAQNGEHDELELPGVGFCLFYRRNRSFGSFCHLGGHWALREVLEISLKRYCSKCEKEVEVKIRRGDNPLTANCPECHGEIRLRSGCGAKL